MNTWRHHFRTTLLGLTLAAASMHAALAQTAEAPLPWVGTWSIAPWRASDTGFNQQTLRQIVHTSIGGTAARIHLSNLWGTQPLVIGSAYLALRAQNASTVPGSSRAVTFGGLAGVTVAPGASVSSDPIAFAVPELADLAVSIYVAAPTTPRATGHMFALQDVYIAPGDVGASTDLPGGMANAASGQEYYFLTNVDVINPAATGAVVAFGASITEGMIAGPNVNRRWPNDLARRLRAGGMTVGVLNQGTSGDRLLFDTDFAGPSGLNRFQRDVLGQPGVKWVIVSDLAVNDLNNGSPPPADQLIAGFKQLAAQAHQADVKFICSTLTPFHGTPQWTQAAEDTRAALHAFMRSADSGCDAIVDQAGATADPADPTRYLPAYDAGDHLHPNEAGLQAIADAVDLGALAGQPPVQAPTACGALGVGQGLRRGQTLLSCDGRFTLNMQNDGNLVLYFDQAPIWHTGTVNSSAAGVVMRADGNLQEFDANGIVLWQSGTSGHPGAGALLQNDGNFVIYAASQPVWASNTCCH